MSRYIDADAFEYKLKEIEAITAMTHKELDEEDDDIGEISMPMFTIRNIMKRCAPIDIVRCKECMYSRDNGDDEDGYYCDDEHHNKEYLVMSGDYCSYGERREQ